MGTGGMFLRKLRSKVKDEPTGFVWIGDTGVAGSGYPASRAQVSWLIRNGIGSILTLTESPLPPEWFEGLDIAVRHIPMEDHGAPTVESLEEAAECIEGERRKGKKVAVHCLAGEGRTGCALAAYLIKSERFGAEEAMAKLRTFKPEFVEKRQEKAVYEFASRSKALS